MIFHNALRVSTKRYSRSQNRTLAGYYHESQYLLVAVLAAALSESHLEIAKVQQAA